MKSLVGIVVGEESDLAILEPAREILKELDVPVDVTVLADYQDSLEKLYLYTLTSGLRGLEVIIIGGDNIPCPVHALTSMTPVPLIYVPVSTGEQNNTSFLPKIADFGNAHSSLLVTRPGDAYAAGLWAAQTLASKHRSVYQSLQEYDGVITGDTLQD